MTSCSPSLHFPFTRRASIIALAAARGCPHPSRVFHYVLCHRICQRGIHFRNRPHRQSRRPPEGDLGYSQETREGSDDRPWRLHLRHGQLVCSLCQCCHRVSLLTLRSARLRASDGARPGPALLEDQVWADATPHAVRTLTRQNVTDRAREDYAV